MSSNDRLTVRSWRHIRHPLSAVWAELLSGHPAWGDESAESFAVPGTPAFGEVGARIASISAPFPRTGIPQVTITELVEVTPLSSRTIEAVAGPIPFREQVTLLADGSWTIVTVELSVPLSYVGASAGRIKDLLQTMVEDWLEQASRWSP